MLSIETAPKDGDRIHLFGKGEYDQTIASWNTDCGDWQVVHKHGADEIDFTPIGWMPISKPVNLNF